MSNLPITITVKLFTAYQEAEGLSELKLEFPKETSVSQVLDRVSAANGSMGIAPASVSTRNLPSPHPTPKR